MQPTHNLTGCSRCRIYHCTVCGCPRDQRRTPNFPMTEQGNAAYVEHRLPPRDRVAVETAALAGILAVTR